MPEFSGCYTGEDAVSAGGEFTATTRPELLRRAALPRERPMNPKENSLEAIRFGKPQYVPLANEPVWHDFQLDGNFRMGGRR